MELLRGYDMLEQVLIWRCRLAPLSKGLNIPLTFDLLLYASMMLDRRLSALGPNFPPCLDFMAFKFALIKCCLIKKRWLAYIRGEVALSTDHIQYGGVIRYFLFHFCLMLHWINNFDFIGNEGRDEEFFLVFYWTALNFDPKESSKNELQAMVHYGCSSLLEFKNLRLRSKWCL
jgi:hypothetical protein